MTIRRVNDVKKYITSKYPKLKENKFDIAKIGARTYIYLVDRNNDLQREPIFQGNLPAMNELNVLKKNFENTIDRIVKKHGYF
jgi:hypothetical protein